MQNAWVEAFTEAPQNSWVKPLPVRVRDKWREILKLAREEDYGGGGSGNWGHKGVPGQHGGSAAGSGGLVAIGAVVGHSRHDRIARSQMTRAERAKWEGEEREARRIMRADQKPSLLVEGLPAAEAKAKWAAWENKKASVIRDMKKEGYQDEATEAAKAHIKVFEDRYMDDDFQEHGMAVSWASGQVKFETHGDQSTIEITPEQLPMLKGTTFSHNHPQGGGFSPTDIATSHAHGVSQVVAFGDREMTDMKRYRYTMTPDPKWTKAMTAPELKKIIKHENNELQLIIGGKLDSGEISYDWANDNHLSLLWPKVEKTVYEQHSILLNYQEEAIP